MVQFSFRTWECGSGVQRGPLACLRPTASQRASQAWNPQCEDGQGPGRCSFRDWKAGRRDRLLVQGEGGEDEGSGRTSGTQHPAHRLQLRADCGSSGQVHLVLGAGPPYLSLPEPSSGGPAVQQVAKHQLQTLRDSPGRFPGKPKKLSLCLCSTYVSGKGPPLTCPQCHSS